MKRLELFTNPDNIKISVDGIEYELRPSESYTPVELIKIQAIKPIIDGLQDSSLSFGRKKELAGKYNKTLAEMLAVMVADWQPEMIDVFGKLGSNPAGQHDTSGFSANAGAGLSELAATVARLQRFYGGSPADWLETPTWLLEGMTGEIARLQAEEDLRAVQVHMIGAGTFRISAGDRNRAISALRRAAKPKAKYGSQTPKAEMLAVFRAAGFGVSEQK